VQLIEFRGGAPMPAEIVRVIGEEGEVYRAGDPDDEDDEEEDSFWRGDGDFEDEED
jgi:hypothetical protein